VQKIAVYYDFELTISYCNPYLSVSLIEVRNRNLDGKAERQGQQKQWWSPSRLAAAAAETRCSAAVISLLSRCYFAVISAVIGSRRSRKLNMDQSFTPASAQSGKVGPTAEVMMGFRPYENFGGHFYLVGE
jgi:hypothetical protein